jgi:hypothetical protein
LALHTRAIRLAVICFAAWGTGGCSGDDPASVSIGDIVNKGPGSRVVLAEHLTVPWDKACIFGPYTDSAEIRRTMELDVADGDARGIHTRDDTNLLIFIHDGRIVRSVAHPRARGDFAPEVVGKCYSKDQAVFLVRIPPAGSWGNIGPS